MLLSVVIPCYNEQQTILFLIDKVCAARLPGKMGREIIIVDDYSTNRTRKLLYALKNPLVKIVYHGYDRKGAALRTGFEAAQGDFIVVQDADLEYDPNEYEKLLGPLLDGRADVVYGSRFLTASERRVLYFSHYVGNRILTFISDIFTNLNLTDMETCYKIFRREVLNKIRIQEDRFGFEPEVTAKVAKLKCRVYEVGISYSGRTYEEGKKIGLRDGFRAMWCIVKYNLAKGPR